MKSRQLNFFITIEDRKLIDDFLVEKECLILANKYIEPGKNPADKLPELQENFFQVYLTKKEYINDIKISIAGQHKYFDVLDETLLEFGLGGFYADDNMLLKRGRFYFVTDVYDKNGNLINKPEEFVSWSTDIISTFKKRFLKKYIKGDPIYYSESAIRWIEDNNATFSNDGLTWKAQ